MHPCISVDKWACCCTEMSNLYVESTAEYWASWYENYMHLLKLLSYNSNGLSNWLIKIKRSVSYECLGMFFLKRMRKLFSSLKIKPQTFPCSGGTKEACQVLMWSWVNAMIRHQLRVLHWCGEGHMLFSPQTDFLFIGKMLSVNITYLSGTLAISSWLSVIFPPFALLYFR